MPSLTILYWRDIPSQVIAKSGRSAAKRQLSERFIRAIDAAAMHAGAKSEDAYLSQWRRGEPIPCGDDLEGEAQAEAERLEKEYDTHRLAVLAKHDGRDGPP
jgi:cvfA/B/C family virulence factor